MLEILSLDVVLDLGATSDKLDLISNADFWKGFWSTSCYCIKSEEEV